MSPLSLYRADTVMMHSKRFKVWFCLIVYFMALGAAEGAVLCIGTDGHVHVKIELTRKAGCGHALSSSAWSGSQHLSGPSSLVCAKDQCAPCVYIPLFIKGSEHQRVSAQFTVFSDLPLSAAPSSDTTPAFSERTAKPGIPIIPHTGNPALDSLRTVILLI